MKEKWLVKFSRFGMFAKGVVYIILGGLALFAALNLGGDITGKKGVIGFVVNQPFGVFFAIVLSLGLMSYSLWRAIQVVKNPENEDNKHRFAYSISGLFYLMFAISVLWKLISGQSGEGSSKSEYVSQLLSSTGGKVILGVIIVGLIIKAIAQFKKIFSKEYYKAIENSTHSKKVKGIIKNFGIIGYASRGVVVLIVSFLFGKALLQNDSSKAGGTEKAFQLIQDSNFGVSLLVVITAGLCMYGVFMILKARYRAMPSL